MLTSASALTAPNDLSMWRNSRDGIEAVLVSTTFGHENTKTRNERWRFSSGPIALVSMRRAAGDAGAAPEQSAGLRLAAVLRRVERDRRRRNVEIAEVAAAEHARRGMRDRQPHDAVERAVGR